MSWDEEQYDFYYWQDQNVNICVCCGRVIPEGRQVCIACEQEASSGVSHGDE